MDISGFPGKKDAKEKKNSFVNNYPQHPRGVLIRDALLRCGVDFYVFVLRVNLTDIK